MKSQERLHCLREVGLPDVKIAEKKKPTVASEYAGISSLLGMEPFIAR